MAKYLSPNSLFIAYISHPISDLLNIFYEIFQQLVIFLFSPRPPRPHQHLNGPRIAVIGAGISGISAAAHCIGHGSDVVIYEAHSRDHLGGIWSQVNSTSSLQIYSVMYRFHPSVQWHKAYPGRHRILEEAEKVWHRYHLEPKTRFNTPVYKVRRNEKGRWFVNDEDRPYDGVIVAIGTCGDPQMPHLPGQEKCKGLIKHSSQLDGVDVKDKRVVVIGGGASAIEAVEYAIAENAARVDILSRSDKWILPRNVIVDSLLSMNIAGYQTCLSFIPEWLLRHFFYRDLADIAPAHKGLFTQTPMCNDQILSEIRAGKAHWLRGDILAFEEDGISFNIRQKGVPENGPGKKVFVPGDVFIYATGFKKPDPHFLPDEAFAAPYEPPAWYLQTFPPEFPRVCAINSMYVNAIGTVGHVHIGLYTRTLLMFLHEARTMPTPTEMKRWVDFTRWLKKRAPGKAFDFFTYSEMMLWIVECVAWNPARWNWVLFVFLGWQLRGGEEGGAGQWYQIGEA